MRVSLWALARPIRVDGITYQTLHAGKEGVGGIDVLGSGLVVVERDGATTLLLDSISGTYGILTAEADDARRAGGRATTLIEKSARAAVKG